MSVQQVALSATDHGISPLLWFNVDRAEAFLYGEVFSEVQCCFVFKRVIAHLEQFALLDLARWTNTKQPILSALWCIPMFALVRAIEHDDQQPRQHRVI